MSSNLAEVVISGTTFPNVLAIPGSTNIGGIAVQASVDESYTDDLEITQHPIEQGSAITDHSFKKPSRVVLRCGWSNSGLSAVTSIVTGLFSGGTMSDASSFVQGIYSQLLKLQQSGNPITVTTGLRTYTNMLIAGLSVTRDKTTSSALMITATLQQVIIVSTQATTLPPQTSQGNPASTADTAPVGTQQVTTGTPAPGGAVPADAWF